MTNTGYDRLKNQVAIAAMAHVNGGSYANDFAIGSRDPYMRSKAVMGRHATQEHLKAGLFDTDFNVKDAASKHKGLTFETAKFFTDNDHTPLNNGLVYNNFRKHPVIGKQISKYLDQKGIK